MNDTAGDATEYHWNKSSWSGRTGQKAFVSTADFNGMTLENAITSLSYTVDTGSSTFWGNAYWNIILEEGDGDRAILAPSYNSATSSGFETDGSAGGLKDFAIFEAEAGWTSTGSGFYAADWSEVKDLTISAGPFTEFPDTLGGTATVQGDPVYTAANWAAWADQSAGSDAGWESDGVLFVFGQSTGTNPGQVVIENVSVNGTPVPEPTTFSLSALGLALLSYGARRQRRCRA
ncbi:MAG: PEP-CTERM sorting domain-containing protein [Deltaproteobacteria bacterium]|nr:PEP-CTERM sorting domain-containing protein [Deltaproteobacteria bacterium]